MKKLTRLGCLCVLVFAGASAFAGTWFGNSVAETLGTGWSNTTGWTWNGGDGSYSNWTDPLTYTATDAQSLAAKDSTISTSVKFTAIAAEDLAEQTIGTDVKGGLTVVEDASTTPSTLSYYGIVNVGNEKRWMPLTGATPTLDAFVDVTVELKNNLNSTYTITYKVGGDTLAVADASFTMATADEATISTVEYIGQFSLASLTGNTWFNPCTIPSSITGISSVKAYDATTESEYELNAIPRGTTVNFAFAAATGYSASVKAASYTTTGDAAPENVTWSDYVVAAAIPVGGDVPSKITVDATEVNARIAEGAAGGENYLFTTQANGQKGWVNYSLGIADNAMIAPTNAVQAAEDEIAVNFGVEVDPDAAVTYSVGGVETEDSPKIALTAGNNTQIVDVKMILTDEGGEKHEVATVKVGVMDTGKDTSKVTAAKTFDIVAVPWDSMSGSDPTVATLLNTGALTPGDKLYVWDDEGEHYDVYELTGGEWISQAYTTRSSVTGETETTSPAAATRTIAKGTAVWIERDPASSIIFAGAITDVTAKLTATVEAGGSEATWSLIANPSVKPYALASIPSPAAGDVIVIEDVAAPKEYTYKDGGWVKTETVITEQTVTRRGKTTTTEVKTLVETPAASDVIPAGIGFWYVRAAGAAAMTLTFEDNDISK